VGIPLRIQKAKPAPKGQLELDMFSKPE
jgi:hypothetical protein